jgi:glycosyltransferase involved in cell wall biosynthesis
MKVLFLTKYPEQGASSRYRVYQYLPYLEEQGVRCTVRPFMGSRLYNLAFQPSRFGTKSLLYVTAFVKRLGAILEARRYDVVYFQRECLPFGPLVVERAINLFGIPTVFDYDDALFIFKKSTHNPMVDRFRRSERFIKIFRLVNLTLAGNDFLRDSAASFCDRAETLHTAENTKRVTLRPPHVAGNPVTIGWLGSASTEKYLHLVTEPLQAVSREVQGVKLKVVGGGSYRAEGLRVEHVPWSYDQEVPQLHSFDVGIMPLPDEEWSKGKCGGKARTYMAAGVPPVCTAVGYNLDLIEHRHTGFLVKSAQDWYEALSALIQDPELRNRVATAARQHVERTFSVDVIAAQMLDHLREVARGR